MRARLSIFILVSFAALGATHCLYTWLNTAWSVTLGAAISIFLGLFISSKLK